MDRAMFLPVVLVGAMLSGCGVPEDGDDFGDDVGKAELEPVSKREPGAEECLTPATIYGSLSLFDWDDSLGDYQVSPLSEVQMIFTMERCDQPFSAVTGPDGWYTASVPQGKGTVTIELGGERLTVGTYGFPDSWFLCELAVYVKHGELTLDRLR